MEVKNIPLVRIHTSPLNPRKTIDEGDLQDLSNNIKQQGLLQPITVRPIEADDTNPLCGEFEIICGERRYRAVSMLEEDTIPCIVREMTDEEALDAMITENLQRKDVDPIEEAFAFGQLLKTGKTIEQIADRIGKSKRFVQERIKLDNLLPDLKKMVKDGKLHIGAAMHVCKLTEDEQRQFLEWCDDQDQDYISRRDAEMFTDNLFMNICKADWHKDFKGSCGTTCIECPFNNANVGCLFYEMKPHDATCTSRERWNKKRHSWLLKRIDDNADVLVKEGDNLEAGKSVIVAESSQYFPDKNTDYEQVLEYIRGKGFKVVNKEDYFERFSSYREDDERLQEKLANNEVYRAVVVESTWRGVEVNVRYYEFKKTGTEHSSDEVKAMQLVNEYKENERKSASTLASKLRDILRDMEPTELSTEPLNQTESLVLMTLILKKCSYQLRNALNINFTYSSDPQVLNYVKAHTEQVHQICRDFLREELSSAGVEYNADMQVCQSMLLQDWAKEQTEQMSTDMAVKLAKKQAKIEEQLTALGYNTDGTKMDF
ncbi:ParB/RepB/Spo0J family partition protein [Sodaliphilus pleomorphus]|uniref:ParB/RepB/Spo0J family partition protein n=1 Tax=Sodaliphilus pleomorphus TaxID=2606626 RepID=A0A6L5X784_9BACT|nr:ParB/RepB/Spo0J family partition protein [Sodaliphilus pleomorphus]MSS16229.1 ParB/RepB/Spo0J family partition protein [Sodaliphilus pleomorphus]